MFLSIQFIFKNEFSQHLNNKTKRQQTINYHRNSYHPFKEISW